jgi:Fic family protein
MLQVAQGHYAFKKPEDAESTVAALMYWSAVHAVLDDRYDWSLRGRSALATHVADSAIPERLSVRTAEASNQVLRLFGRFQVLLRKDDAFDGRLVKPVELAGEQLRVDVPELVLVELSDRADDPVYRAFVAGTNFDSATLEAIYRRRHAPTAYRRAAAVARDVRRADLAAILDRIVGKVTIYAPASLLMTPLAPTPKLTPPWESLQTVQLGEFADRLTRTLGQRIAALSSIDLGTLVASAQAARRYDIYHSTSIEGYRVTPEDVSVLLAGSASQFEGDPEEIRNRIAVLGYARAFDLTLERAGIDDSSSKPEEHAVRETYAALFSPSVDAGLVDPLDLVDYRQAQVFIRDSRHTPPPCEKVPGLMRALHAALARIDAPFVQAVLWHLGLVTIHPYLDGNGRTARLVMNYRLLTAGLPWVTIRTEERGAYFDALAAGQVGGDPVPFGRFILRHVEEAVRTMGTRT